MIEADVCLYLASRLRLARLEKVVRFAVLPRVREYVKVRNHEQGDYFAFTVVQITHREDGRPELWLHLRTRARDKWVIDFFEDGELDEYVTGYELEGWVLASIVPNTTIGDDYDSVWSVL